MDVRLALRAFVDQGRELYHRLHSSEGDIIGPVDLHILEVQLYLLDKEVARRKTIHHASVGVKTPRPDLPPFSPDEKDKL